MKILFDINKNYCWLNRQILLVLVSYEDHRCYQTPHPTHVCFWEGDFSCVFEVYKIDWRQTSPRCQWLKTIVLNDHDHKKNKWTAIPVPASHSPSYVLFLSGGPGYASGYKQTHNLTFEITVRKEA